MWTPEPSLGPRVVACDAPGLITPHWFAVRWVPARGLSRPAHTQSGLGVQRTVSGTLTASAAIGPPGPKGYGRRPVIGDPIGTVSPVRRRGGRRRACTLSVPLGPRHPLDGRLVSAYRRSTGQCATWTRGTTRRRGAEARPRPGQTKAPTPSARLLGNPQKLQRNEVHTRQNTRDPDPRRIDQNTRDHDPRQIDQCNIHAHVIVPDNKSPVEKKLNSKATVVDKLNGGLHKFI